MSDDRNVLLSFQLCPEYWLADILEKLFSMNEQILGSTLLTSQPIHIDAKIRRLFPLALVPFETMMVIDDRWDYPMLAELELHFRGHVDWEAWQYAIAGAVVRHPLLYALLDKTMLGGFRWVMPAQENAELSIVILKKHQADSVESAAREMRTPINLFKHAGARFLLAETNEGLQISICVHHACIDGIGLMQLVEDLLAIYQQQTTKLSEILSLRELVPSRLIKRGVYSIESKGFRRMIKDFIFGLQLAHRFGRDKPDPIATDCGNTEPVGIADDGDNLAAGDFSGLLRPLRKAAARSGVTLNDLLIRDLFLTIREWNCYQDSSTHDRRYRIMMPCDLRGPEHAKMPAANRMSYSFLSRSESDLASTDDLLDGIRGETEYIRSQNASLYFIRSLQVAHRIPGGMRRVVDAGQCLSTALLSNLGDPTLMFGVPFSRQAGKISVGNLILERIRARPPLRPLTHIGLVVNTYANQLSIGIAYDHLHLSKRDSFKFLRIYRSHLQRTVSSDKT